MAKDHQQVSGGDSSPPLSIGDAAAGVLGPVLGFPVLEKPGHKSPEEDQGSNGAVPLSMWAHFPNEEGLPSLFSTISGVEELKG